MVDVSQFKVGVVLDVEDCGNPKKGKPLKSCKVNVGDEENPVTIVTSASNVRNGSRVVVALAGSTVYNAEGEEEAIQKTTVGGSMSEGMLCDAKMLGWSGGAVGIAVQVPESFSIGSAPPATKPRGGNQAAEEPQGQAPQAEGLFEKKLTKEEKKKLAEERRKARAAKKAAKKAQEEEQG
mmetsp:Transcript_16822/g.38741  ORF Transcript_16822/g.38741 Transcript_16822/m.38741 type:complete len:180 (+) Transcript_16822:740-1279(+)